MSHSTEIEVQPTVETEQVTAKDPLYRVVMINDDYTPMEFVVAVLVQVFRQSVDDAEKIMLRIHHEGRGVCGVFTHEIAEAMVAKVSNIAEHHKHPLLCIIEMDE